MSSKNTRVINGYIILAIFCKKSNRTNALYMKFKKKIFHRNRLGSSEQGWYSTGITTSDPN
jgi:hypothetical protein